MCRWPDGATAVITGANKGLGYEIARLMGSEGVHVVITSRDAGRGKAALQSLQENDPHAKFSWFQADVTDSSSVQQCAEQLKHEHGHIEWLINNAGIAYRGDIFGAEEAQNTMDVNLKGTRAFTEAMLPLLQPGSRVVNMCSRCTKRSLHMHLARLSDV